MVVIKIVVSLLILVICVITTAQDDSKSKDINTVIKKGVEFLSVAIDDNSKKGPKFVGKKELVSNYLATYPVGIRALIVYTLIKCGVRPTDKLMEKNLAFLCEKDPESTYCAALVSMALSSAILEDDSKGTTANLSRYKKRLQQIADILIASQKSNGGWRYHLSKPGTAPANTQDTDYDFSVTQFAVLGLRAAANANARIPKAVWSRALQLLESGQNSDGGWGYQAKGTTTRNMTAAGISSYLICKSSTSSSKIENLRKEKSVSKAIEWIKNNWDSQCKNMSGSYYWMYSLERACMIAGIDKIGDYDWYEAGKNVLITTQNDDGSWLGEYDTLVSTSFALLFLRKAYIETPGSEKCPGSSVVETPASKK